MCAGWKAGSACGRHDLEAFFGRLPERFENPFTIRNIISGQKRLLELPLLRELVAEDRHAVLLAQTVHHGSLSSKAANNKHVWRSATFYQLATQPVVHFCVIILPTKTTLKCNMFNEHSMLSWYDSLKACMRISGPPS